MSFKGELEARCPNGCPSFDTEVWSFIRGDTDPELRETVRARECNLLLCPGCEKPFYADAPYVYFEPGAELLAFVFPESYKKHAAHWVKKMRADFGRMQGVLAARMPTGLDPEVFFGVEGLAELLELEDFRRTEVEVMEAVAKELGLSLYRVSPCFARKAKIPAVLPCSAAPGKPAAIEGVIEGLKTLLKANGRLRSFRDYLKVLAKAKGGLPPAIGASPPAAGSARGSSS
ncbi:MAG: hypothetical protein HY748_08580 [Elusimicrobia bacterium]|nr:hypothetical protein [Elusimicrobiota bacterium]